jgi:ATP-dependent Lhr-like helicase
MSIPGLSLLFHPLVTQWFEERLGTPTDVQAKVWPEIVRGRHVLVTAPTGSGKTLAAFLWALDQLLRGEWPGNAVRVLYVSPLKALNNDVQRNLLRPLAELKALFARSGMPVPDVSVLTRSGDTPGDERRRMVRRPPEILITTPESLNLLLASRSGRSLLTGIRTVVLDEIHSVVGTKRGTHLITAVERLVLLSGEFQRIALSATVNPAERVADFVGGFHSAGSGIHEKRPVLIVRSSHAKSYDIRVASPKPRPVQSPPGSWWPALIVSFKDIILRHRSTLLFTNSRRTAEKVTRLINQGEERELAYSHHGSLAREIRLAVEQKLKNGELKAIVATSSLELGIDIGSLDQVVLVQTPRSVSSAVQRIGRSGHDVGETSRGAIFPTHGRDFLHAAVMARSVLEQDIEEAHPVESPLDVLAQVILSMTAMEPWDIDRLYQFVKTSYPYRNLIRPHFDAVLDLLNGRYADTRMRQLKGRVSLDRIDNTVQAHSEVRYLLYSSGGTIPERGYFDLRLQDNHAKIGELDEEFVWERRIGDTFALGSQLWRVSSITHNTVEVLPVKGAGSIVPFWRAEEQHRDFHFSERIGLFLEGADARLDSEDLKRELRERHRMDDTAADELISFLRLQKEAVGRSLPHRHHLLVEHIHDAAAQGDVKQIVLHTLWGGRVNNPFALALAHAWEEREGVPLQIVLDDDGILLTLPKTVHMQDLLALVGPRTVEMHLRKKLEQSGFFGARFRENAERALLLPKAGFRRRMPLWLMRLRAKELLTAVQPYGDFPIVLETWRTCLQDEFDMENLTRVLNELQDGRIRVSEVVTRKASAFAEGLVWKQTNASMYEDDTPARGGEPLRTDVIKELLGSSSLRPKIPAAVIGLLDEKLKGAAPGYSPGSPQELLDWIKDRLLVPEPEWRQLAAAIRRDHDADAAQWLAENGRKMCWLSWPGVRQPLLAGLEAVPRVLVAFRLLLQDVRVDPVTAGEQAAALKRRAEAFLGQDRSVPPEEYDLSVFLSAWLAFYGPVPQEEVTQLLGVTPERLDEALGPLAEDGTVVLDRFSEASTRIEICDAGNLEILLRLARRYRQPSFQALPLAALPVFLAGYQGISPPGSSLEELQQRLEQLFGWPAPVGAWEEYLLPARIKQYRNDSLDDLFADSDLVWFGCGERRIGLAFQQDLELFRMAPAAGGTEDARLDQLIPDRRGKYSFLEIAAFSHMDTVHAGERLWKEAWKGHVTSDTFRTVRKALLTGFAAKGVSDKASPALRRSGFDRWKASRPVEGHWQRIDAEPADRDVLDEEELNKERIRQLFRRYGVLFRELLMNELPMLQWKALFRSLRLMELSGEVLSGYFFEGPAGPQFVSPEAFRMLQEPLPQDRVFWINAADPASLCGVALPTGLPPRVPSTYLVYRGSRLVLIARRMGKALQFLTEPDDAGMLDHLMLFRDLLNRDFKPLSKVTVETINGEPAHRSRYAETLKQFGFRMSRNVLELWKEY